jgi:hypothetical protein
MCWFRDQTFGFCENCKWALKVSQKRGRYVYRNRHEQAGKETFVTTKNENSMPFYSQNALKFRWRTQNNIVEYIPRCEVLNASYLRNEAVAIDK